MLPRFDKEIGEVRTRIIGEARRVLTQLRTAGYENTNGDLDGYYTLQDGSELGYRFQNGIPYDRHMQPLSPENFPFEKLRLDDLRAVLGKLDYIARKITKDKVSA